MNKIVIDSMYKNLLEDHQPQGWWPLTDLKQPQSDNLSLRNGYHPLDYSPPENKDQQFEICLGAILTQNTSWHQAEKAIAALRESNLLDLERIGKLDLQDLKQLIRPSGYYNQKARKIIEFSHFFANLAGATPGREDLLQIWGIGKETADSILLYAYKQPYFVVDAYCRRMFSRISGQICQHYDLIQQDIHEKYIDLSQGSRVVLFNELHSLIVVHCKNVCQKQPRCGVCQLKDLCQFYQRCEVKNG